MRRSSSKSASDSARLHGHGVFGSYMGCSSAWVLFCQCMQFAEPCGHSLACSAGRIAGRRRRQRRRGQVGMRWAACCSLADIKWLCTACGFPPKAGPTPFWRAPGGLWLLTWAPGVPAPPSWR